MTGFPVAPNLAAARAPEAKRARTEDEAHEAAGGPVFLAVEELPESFATPDEAEAAAPDLYGGGRYELYWRDGSWRMSLRFWRPAPPAPVARSVELAAKAPMGHARTPEEARDILGTPAELVQARLANLYVDHRQLMRRWGELVRNGLAEIVEQEGKFAVALSFWRALKPGKMTPAERKAMQARAIAPMRGSLPQAPLDYGLFERPAPENPDIILAEEGDGRFGGE